MVDVIAGQSTWCKLVAWAALMDLTALLGGSIIISYTTWRLVAGHPISDRLLISWNIGNWVASGIVASGFWIDGIVGPYKNIYCCVRQDEYKVWSSTSTLVFIFGASIINCIFYRKAYHKLLYMEKNLANNTSASAHTKASRIVVQRGTLLVFITNMWWSLIIVAGFITAVGGTVPALLDIFGAFLVKCMPLFDSYFFHGMLKKVVQKDAQVNPERDSRLAKAKDSNSGEIRKNKINSTHHSKSQRHSSALNFLSSNQKSNRSRSKLKSSGQASKGYGKSSSKQVSNNSSSKHRSTSQAHSHEGRASESQKGPDSSRAQSPQPTDAEAGMVATPAGQQQATVKGDEAV